ncbi:MAG: hypothetical protein ACRD1D_10480 [Acidimicrobiales bacterium]
MGRCHEFGSQIREGCGHPMVAGERACACPECGVVCQGQFDGCPEVWARGPRPVALTLAPAINAPRVRALAAGARPSQAQAPPTGAASNGHSGHSAPPPPPPPPPQSARPPGNAADSRTEILQWFEDAFGELRNELHAVVSTVTRQQAMLAELLDSREAELRVVMVAESLPELAGEAAAKALADQSDSLADVVGATLDDVRATVESSELSNAAVMDGMRELLRRVEVTAEVNTEDARLEGAARLESLKASVSRQLRPVSAAVAELAAYVEMAEEREAARTRALKASITKQLQPLAATVEAAVARSDRQMAEIRARLDALGAPKVRPASTAAPKGRAASTAAPKGRAASTAAPKGRAAPAKARARKATNPGAEPAATEERRPPVGGLLNRRRPAARPTGSGPLAGA